jgi:hypothetical protein
VFCNAVTLSNAGTLRGKNKKINIGIGESALRTVTALRLPTPGGRSSDRPCQTTPPPFFS